MRVLRVWRMMTLVEERGKLVITCKTNIRVNIPRPKIMKVSPQTLRKTTRNLVALKIAANCKLFQQEEYVNNCNKSPSKSILIDGKKKLMSSRQFSND
jgi:hypothetical protein